MKKILLLLLVVMVFLFGYWIYEEGQYKEITVHRGTIQLVVASSGEVHADKEANLRFGSTGRITYLPFRENDVVKKGQVVASLDTSDLKAIQERELLYYQDARAALEEQRDIYSKNNTIIEGTEKHLLESKQTAVDRSVINVEIADRAAKNASLYAPFDGVITGVNGQVNEWTNAFSSQPLISVADFNTLYFEADVDQENSDGIQPGQSAIITFDAHKRVIHHGIVAEVSQQVKTTVDGDKVIAVRIQIIDPGDTLKLHFDGDAQITIGERKETLLLPKSAVERDEKEAYVYVGNGILKQKKRITLGTFDGNNWEILQGLTENEKVLLKK